MNNVTIMGRLTKDVDVKEVNDKKVAKFTIAVDKRFNKDKADFIACTAWGPNADFAEKYLKKGTGILARGEWTTGSYQNKDGNTVYTNDLNVEELQFNSINSVTVAGRLTKDPDVKEVNDKKVARLTIAVGRRGKKDEADFISCTAWRANAEFAEKYLKKGSAVAINGSWRTGSYQNKDGETVYTNDLVVDNISFTPTNKKDNAEAPAAEEFEDDFLDMPFDEDDLV